MDESRRLLADQRLRDAARRAKIATAADQELWAMQEIAAMEVLSDDSPAVLVQTIEELRSGLKRSIEESGSETTPLAALPARKRKMYEHLFELIYESSANRVAAKARVDRMLRKLA
jgi:hypothetical protein